VKLQHFLGIDERFRQCWKLSEINTTPSCGGLLLVGAG